MAPSFTSHEPPKFHVLSWQGLQGIILSIVVSNLVYILIIAVYNLYFHPLRNIPGPKTWIAFPLIRHLALMKGQADIRIREYHETYGEVVRLAPNVVSFTSSQAWKDIYGHGHPELPKYTGLPPDSITRSTNIIHSNAADHSRFRRALGPAFSERGLRDQEPIIKVYIDLLISKLKDVSSSGMKTDMTKWYNFTTFDLIGDLAFGESFDGLKDTKSHHWIESLSSMLKFFPILSLAIGYPILFKLLKLLASDKIKSAQENHVKMAKELTLKRVNDEKKHGRGDFMDSMLRFRGQANEITDDELAANADVLIVAGSETTATLLSGVTFWLLREPRALEKLTKEVRSAFQSEDEINFINATARLPYMLACLEEALRVYPPVPIAIPRQCLPGPPTPIAGYLIPEKTVVGVHHSAAYSSSANFHNAKSYVPERWLPEATSDPNSPYYHDNRDVVKPFSYGPRDCIGRNLAYHEMRLILARMIWNFDLELCQESQRWNEQRTFALWEKPPLWCQLKPRKN